MSLKIYEYKNCSTCQKALKFLDSMGMSYEKIPIVEQPPTLAELKQMLLALKDQGGSLKNLLNTSGEQYRALGMSEKLKDGLTELEALKILASNGKLIKRPFVLTPKSGLVGFKADAWERFFSK